MRKKITDSTLAAEAEKNRFNRDERIQNAVGMIVVILLWAIAIVGIAFLTVCAIIYSRWLLDGTFARQESIENIRTIFYVICGAAGGYLLKLLQKSGL